MIEHDTPKQAAEKGEFLMNKLLELQDRHPGLVREVRGAGLMIGIEFFTSDIGYSFAKGMFSRRVMTAGTLNNAQTIRVEPPLTISCDDLNTVLERMSESLDDIGKKGNGSKGGK
jgi:putrescine aminotransferase